MSRTARAYGQALVKNGEWKEDAACEGREGDWVNMPPNVTWRGHRRLKALELAVCDGCQVRVECLNYAIANRETVGIWGGLVPYERTQRARNKT